MSTWTRLWERNAHRGETLRPACGTLLRWLHRQSSGPLCRSAAGTDAGGGASWTWSSETLSCSCCPSVCVDRLSRGPYLDLRLEKRVFLVLALLYVRKGQEVWKNKDTVLQELRSQNAVEEMPLAWFPLRLLWLVWLQPFDARVLHSAQATGSNKNWVVVSQISQAASDLNPGWKTRKPRVKFARASAALSAAEPVWSCSNGATTDKAVGSTQESGQTMSPTWTIIAGRRRACEHECVRL